MTERIYEQDQYCSEFEATVLSCTFVKDRYEIILDRSAFYPEGGGQPGDFGELQDVKRGVIVSVFDTHSRNEEIIHYAKEPIMAGSSVIGKIDWINRFDNMQNHSGEHIVSGLIHNRYGYNNVGFHMGSDFITIDLDGELTMEQLSQIEELANITVWENKETLIRCYSEAEAAEIQYRSKKELHGIVRVVTFQGADTCACCGTHVKRTGEIGLIKLISCQKFREGVRVEMLCGRRALSYMHAVWLQNREISVSLSAKPLSTAEAVNRLKQQQNKDSFKVIELQRKVFAQIAKGYEGSERAVLFEDGLQADDVRRLTLEVMEYCDGICMVLSGDDTSGYKYCVGKKDADIRTFVKDMNSLLSGRGGGKPFFAQGSYMATKKKIKEVLNKLLGQEGAV